MDNEIKTLGQKLRDLREDFDLSQNQIAAALNIDRSTYTNYELNKTQPNLETLVKLAHIFQIRPSYLLPLDEHDGDLAVRESLQSSSMLKSLSKAERGLIATYRSQSKAKQELIRQAIDKIAKSKDE